MKKLTIVSGLMLTGIIASNAFAGSLIIEEWSPANNFSSQVNVSGSALDVNGNNDQKPDSFNFYPSNVSPALVKGDNYLSGTLSDANGHINFSHNQQSSVSNFTFSISGLGVNNVDLTAVVNQLLKSQAAYYYLSIYTDISGGSALTDCQTMQAGVEQCYSVAGNLDVAYGLGTGND